MIDLRSIVEQRRPGCCVVCGGVLPPAPGMRSGAKSWRDFCSCTFGETGQ